MLFRRCRPAATLAFCLLIYAAPAFAAETITLDNGDRLTGAVVRMSDGIVQLKTSYAGTIGIKWSDIRELRSDDEPMRVRLSGNGTIPVKTIIRNGEVMLLDQQTEPTANITQINPDDWETGKGSKLCGEVALSMKLDRGNSHENRADLSTRLEWKKLKHRARLAGELEYNKTDGLEAQNRWSVETAYDNRFSKHLYYGASTALKRDRMSELEMRWTAGPYVGWHIIDRPGMKLSIENGVEYTSETYESRGAERFICNAWRVEFSYVAIADKLELYHRNKGLLSLANAGGVSSESWSGLKAPIGGGLNTSAELKTSYNSDAPEGAVAWDTAYRLKLGYQW